MRNYADDNIENGMVLFDERDYWKCDEEELAYRDYLDEEADRQWKEWQEERLRYEKNLGIKEEELK